MRVLCLICALAAGTASATTLQMLSTDQMIRQSTAIVRAKVTGSSTIARGSAIYTVYRLSVEETLKGSGTFDSVSVPGGALGGLRQMVSGAPSLAIGQDYVIFLWTSRSGLTQIIGLSQGLFSVTLDSSGDGVLTRPGSSMKLSDLRSQVQKVLN